MSKKNKDDKEIKKVTNDVVKSAKETEKESKKEKRFIVDKPFTTLCSIKQALICSELSGDKPEFVAYSKKGKIKLLKVKKNDIITLTTHDKFSVKLNGTDLSPVKTISLSDEEDKWNIYEIPFKVFTKAISESIFSIKDNTSYSTILCAVDKNDGELYKVWDVSKSFATISNPDKENKNIDLRLDL